MGNFRDDFGLEKSPAQMMQERTELLKQFIDEGILKAKAEVAAEFAARGGPSDKDIRMSCLHMARDNFHGSDIATKAVINEAEELAQYVLTGKKPGEA